MSSFVRAVSALAVTIMCLIRFIVTPFEATAMSLWFTFNRDKALGHAVDQGLAGADDDVRDDESHVAYIRMCFSAFVAVRGVMLWHMFLCNWVWAEHGPGPELDDAIGHMLKAVEAAQTAAAAAAGPSS